LQGEMDGIEAAEHIQQAFGIPVIYLTAQTEETVLQSVRIKAPFGYIGKPVKEHELQASIEMALSGKSKNNQTESFAEGG
ncbi:unnamed protein product, partial [marine sediment metagenome]